MAFRDAAREPDVLTGPVVFAGGGGLAGEVAEPVDPFGRDARHAGRRPGGALSVVDGGPRVPSASSESPGGCARLRGVRAAEEITTD